MPYKNYNDKLIWNKNDYTFKNKLNNTDEKQYFKIKERCCFCGDNLKNKNIYRTISIHILCNRCYSYTK